MAILSGRGPIESDDRVEVAGIEGAEARGVNGGVDPRALALGGRRLERPIPRLHLEPEAFVQPPSPVGGDQDEGDRAGVSSHRGDRLGQRDAEPASSMARSDPDRADPGDRPIDGRDSRADDFTPEVRDDGVARPVAQRELEPRAPVAPLVGEDRGDRRIEVAPGHRAEARGQLHAAIIGRWPRCRGRMWNTSPISRASD